VREGGPAAAAAWEAAASLLRARPAAVAAEWTRETPGRGRSGAGVEALLQGMQRPQ
jgi:hypothetical protein